MLSFGSIWLERHTTTQKVSLIEWCYVLSMLRAKLKIKTTIYFCNKNA